MLYLYTMGDAEYTKAVMDVIDPKRKFFTGEQSLCPSRLPAPHVPCEPNAR